MLKLMELLANILGALSVFYFFNDFFEPKIVKNRILLIAMAVVTNIILSAWINSWNNIYLNVLWTVMQAIVWGSLFSNEKLGKIIVFSFILSSIYFISELLVVFAISMFYGSDLLNLTIIEHSLALILSKLISFGLITIIVKKFARKNDTVAKRTYLPILIYPIVTTLLAFGIVKIVESSSVSPEIETIIFAFLILLLSTGFIVLLFYSNVLYQKDLELKNSIQGKYSEMYLALQNNIDEKNALIHDFKNNIANIKKLYENNSSQAQIMSTELLKSYQEHMVSQPIEVNNIVVTVILERFIARCKELNINYDLDIYYKDLEFIDVLDTSTLFDNLLDNAIDGCLKSEIDKSYIQVLITKKNNYLIISVKNTYNGIYVEKNGILLSSKREHNRPGIGVKQIKHIADKYNGDIIWEGNEFVFHVIVRLLHFGE